MSNEQAEIFIDDWMRTYGGNHSKYSCFAHKSKYLAVLSIREYPKTIIIQYIICLGVSFVILVACTMKTCGYGEQTRQKTVKYNHRNRIQSRKSFQWKISIENYTGKESKDGVSDDEL